MKTTALALSLLLAGGAVAQTRGGAPASPGFGQTYATPAGSGSSARYFSSRAHIQRILNSPAVEAGKSEKALSLRDLRDDALALQAKDGGELTARHSQDIEDTYNSIMTGGG